MEDLKGIRLVNLRNLSRKRQREFKALRESTLETARAWAIRSRLEPIKKVAKTIKEYL